MIMYVKYTVSAQYISVIVIIVLGATSQCTACLMSTHTNNSPPKEAEMNIQSPAEGLGWEH